MGNEGVKREIEGACPPSAATALSSADADQAASRLAPDGLQSTGAALIALAERCEQAPGPDRELDALIAVELGFAGRSILTATPFTSSLDEAVALVPKGCVWMLTNTSIQGRKAELSRATALVGQPDDTEGDDVEAATAALALTAACLRVRAASGIVAATSGRDAQRLDERSEQSPVGDSRDAQNPPAQP